MPPLKLTFSHLKMDSWNTMVSFSDGLFSGAFAVSFGVGITTKNLGSTGSTSSTFNILLKLSDFTFPWISLK